MAESSSPTVAQHQVFINFRGVELHRVFVSHLVSALESHSIVVIDDYEDNGKNLDSLLKNIGESRIALVVFSAKYTKSTRCLEELAKIKDRADEGKLVLIPIFYRLEPSAVRNLEGDFGDAFRSLAKGDKRKPKWEDIFRSIQNILNLTIPEKSCSEESNILNKIVWVVRNLLIRIPLEAVQDASVKTSGSSDSTGTLSGEEKHKTFTVHEKSKLLQPQTQVFINFRGDQLRTNFICYLVEALRRSDINVFIDTQAPRGEDINNLFNKIEESGVAIVVFSSRYTESKWCLNELRKINERENQGMLKVLPVFYKVSPINVKRLKGEFGDHFRDQEYKYRYEEDKIKQWKEAMALVSNKFALVLEEKSGVLETDFVKDIVVEVLKMLKDISTTKSSQSCSCPSLCGEKQSESQL
ncbi:unnamed protein product [Eruca vesicaria subsp. sativa]|uniref:TIR domain-containing protein n=1 Tax=Eruca vesicaria subsp. sativa TaxID=29727 RepID=A0ABC8L5D6_ERUVS|nr:unnamed protein product [Eruca vesicaria subsp. sativa]